MAMTTKKIKLKPKLQKGDKVKILMPDMTVYRRKDGKRSSVSKTGIVLHTNGAYVWVRPSRWPCSYIEFLVNEVEKI